jgi:hypothetical protein
MRFRFGFNKETVNAHQILCDDVTFLSRAITGDESSGFTVMILKQTTILPMETSKFTETERAELGKKQSQEHAHYFL